MSLINSSVSGYRKPHINKTVAKPVLTNVATDFGNASATNRKWRDFVWDGADHVYAARDIDGVVAINVSDPANPVISDSSLSHDTGGGNSFHGCRGVIIVGDTLVSCTRTGSDGTGTGRIETWDISTSGTLGSNVGVTTDVYETTNPNADLYSYLATDGTTLFVSGQISGGYSFDVSDRSSITLITAITSGSWETQGCYADANNVYFANYVFGIRICDIASGGVIGGVSDNSINPVTDGTALRPWNVVADGNYLYASTNTTSYPKPHRGITVLDIGSASWVGKGFVPTTVDDLWDGSGDSPANGICKVGDYVYVTYGEAGMASFYVKDHANPIYTGMVHNLDSGDTVWEVAGFTVAGINYLIYGDGLHATSTDGSEKLYIDKITYTL